MSGTSSSSRRLPRIAVTVAIVAAVLGGLYWFFGPGDPAEVDATAALEQADAADTVDAEDGTESPADEATSDPATDVSEDGGAAVEGVLWTVDTDAVEYSFADGAGTFVGFRIDEELSSVGKTEAVGRTPEVDGSVTIAGTTVTAADFTGDARALTTDRSQRDRRAQAALGDGVLSFELTEPVELDDEPAPGVMITTDATGDLTINGVTKQYTLPLAASLSESGLLAVTTSFPVMLSDHDVEAPSASIVLSVSDTATVEVQLFLTDQG